MHLDVDEAGRDNAPLRVEHERTGTGRQRGADLGDHTAGDTYVGHPFAGRVDNSTAPYDDFTLRHRHQTTGPPEPNSDHNTAMRTATPFATCSVTSERVESATSAAI
jgi:hypothetical protein